jgi:hypothetical protein
MSVEQLHTRIDELALERQRLRERSAPTAALERNRLELVRAQQALSYALIQRYGRAA